MQINGCKNYIYGLMDPVTNTVRYVGKSASPSDRFRQHLVDSPRLFDTPNRKWLHELHALNLKPLLIILEECTHLNWQAHEQFWIAYFKFLGADLHNVYAGGEGGKGHKMTEEMKSRKSLEQKGRSRPKRNNRDVPVVRRGTSACR